MCLFRIIFETDFHELQMQLSSQIKSGRNGRCIGIHSEQEKRVTEPRRLRKDPKENTKPNVTIKRLTLPFFCLSIVGNFLIDVNFTEILGEPNSVEMIVDVNAQPETEPMRFVCEGLIGIYLLNLPNCQGLDISVPHTARLLSSLTNGGQSNNEALFEIMNLDHYFDFRWQRNHNCLRLKHSFITFI